MVYTPAMYHGHDIVGSLGVDEITTCPNSRRVDVIFMVKSMKARCDMKESGLVPPSAPGALL
jgi:hypothetical protein